MNTPYSQPRSRQTQSHAPALLLRVFSVSLLAAAVASPGTATAQAAAEAVAGPMSLTLPGALRLARAQAPAVLAAAAQVSVAEQRVGSAEASLRPSLSGAVGLAGQGQMTQFVGDTSAVCGPLAAGQCDTTRNNGSVFADATLTGRWTLFDFGRSAAAVQAAERGVDGARQDQASIERTAQAAAANAYFAVLADQAAVEVARLTVAQRERQLGIARARVAAQVAAPIEVSRAELSLQSARADVERVEWALQRDVAALASALGLSPTTSLVLAPASAPTPADEPGEAARRAVETRPELRAARERVAAAESQIAVSAAGWRPSLGATASVGARLTRTDDPTNSVAENTSAALTLTLPFLDPTVAAAVRTAQAAALAARASADQLEQAIRAEAVDLSLALQSARASLQQVEQAAALAAANLAQAEGRYRAGAAGLLELVDAQVLDVQARSSLVAQRYGVARAAIQLVAATGQWDSLLP